ncbi:unnamed protein product, partial [Amoebophrya sp. A120]|eukprot:GSA120T00007703001.1
MAGCLPLLYCWLLVALFYVFFLAFLAYQATFFDSFHDILGSCSEAHAANPVVTASGGAGFDLDRFSGDWYEAARIANPFETEPNWLDRYDLLFVTDSGKDHDTELQHDSSSAKRGIDREGGSSLLANSIQDSDHISSRSSRQSQRQRTSTWSEKLVVRLFQQLFDHVPGGVVVDRVAAPAPVDHEEDQGHLERGSPGEKQVSSRAKARPAAAESEATDGAARRLHPVKLKELQHLRPQQAVADEQGQMRALLQEPVVVPVGTTTDTDKSSRARKAPPPGVSIYSLDDDEFEYHVHNPTVFHYSRSLPPPGSWLVNWLDPCLLHLPFQLNIPFCDDDSVLQPAAERRPGVLEKSTDREDDDELLAQAIEQADEVDHAEKKSKSTSALPAGVVVDVPREGGYLQRGQLDDNPDGEKIHPRTTAATRVEPGSGTAETAAAEDVVSSSRPPAGSSGKGTEKTENKHNHDPQETKETERTPKLLFSSGEKENIHITDKIKKGVDPYLRLRIRLPNNLVWTEHDAILKCAPADPIPDPATNSSKPSGKLSGDCEARFSWFPILFRHTVTATDYESYATLYSCFSFGGIFKYEYAWALVRHLPPRIFVKDNKEVDYIGVTDKHRRKIKAEQTYAAMVAENVAKVQSIVGTARRFIFPRLVEHQDSGARKEVEVSGDQKVEEHLLREAELLALTPTHLQQKVDIGEMQQETRTETSRTNSSTTRAGRSDEQKDLFQDRAVPTDSIQESENKVNKIDKGVRGQEAKVEASSTALGPQPRVEATTKMQTPKYYVEDEIQ